MVARALDRFHRRSFFAGAPGGTVGPLTVQVLGPEIRGVPGRNGRRDPVSGVPVTFEFKFRFKEHNDYVDHLPYVRFMEGRSEDAQEAGFDGSPRSRSSDDTRTLPASLEPPRFRPALGLAEATGVEAGSDRFRRQNAPVFTDRDGYARIFVELGDIVGDYRVEAETRDRSGKRLTVDFWILSGLEVIPAEPQKRESPVGSHMRVSVRLFANDVDPQEPYSFDVDRAVYFTAVPNSTGAVARLSSDKDRTNDEQGIANVELELGSRTGVYPVLVEVEPTERTPGIRGLVVDFYATDRLDIALGFIAGVVLFVLALRLLESGLLIQYSSFLEAPARRLAANRVLGFLGGCVAGATFLSSTGYVTRLVIFANGGLLAARAATGQLLGAQLGETALLQVLAFDVRDLAIPLLGLGSIIRLAPGPLHSKAWGGVFLGLGGLLLSWGFFGETSQSALASPTFAATLASWDPGAAGHAGLATAGLFATCGLVALVAGLAVRNALLPTVVVLAFAIDGLVSPLLFVAVVIGGQMGGALAISIQSLSRGREARRVAMTNVLVLLFGSLWLIALSAWHVDGQPSALRAIDWLMPGRLFHPQPENTGPHLAALAAAFPAVNALLFLPLAPAVGRLVERLIPRDPVHDDIKPYRLDINLVDVPALAVTQATRELIYLAEMARKTIAESFDAFRYKDLSLADQIARREESIVSIHREVSQYLLRTSENDLSTEVAARLQFLQSVAANLHRIAKQGELLRNLAALAIEEEVDVPADVMKDLMELHDLVMSQFENALHLLEHPDPRTEENAVKLGERLARSATRIESGWIQRTRPGKEDVGRELRAASLTFIVCRDAHTNLTLVARHLADIAERRRVLARR